MTAEQTSTRPLAGLRIVELSSYVAAPLCGLTLAQLGAEVIRVEPMGGGPDRRRWPLAEGGSSLYWNGLNGGKSAIEINLSSFEGRRIVADLVVGGGGILITNTEQWAELTYSALRTRRADVIHVLLTGKHDGSTAVDYTVQAGTGFPLVTGPHNNHAPVNHVLPAWDLAAGLYLALGLLTAERRRTTAGSGSELRVALEDVALATTGQLGYLTQAQLSPDTPRTADGNSVYGSFGQDFVSADGVRFMLVALTTRQWIDLQRITGLGALMASVEREIDADFSDEGDRYQHRKIIEALVAGWFQRHDADEVQRALVQTRLLWSTYRSFADLAADDARVLRQNPLFAAVDQPGVGTVLAPGSPITFDGNRAAPRPAPGVGQQTIRVLTEHLGMSQGQLDEAAARGVLRRPESATTHSEDTQ